ncbi:hypothetical protein ACIPSE_32195 [Streptomyces sp. NPDC090106]|uniref:hypothetical protein n=1 Tax=Streptomyces sp. NPDC090106 TaxID=3365946 RepID=UPI003828E346
MSRSRTDRSRTDRSRTSRSLNARTGGDGPVTVILDGGRRMFDGPGLHITSEPAGYRVGARFGPS